MFSHVSSLSWTLWLQGMTVVTVTAYSMTSMAYRNPVLPGFHPDPSCTLVKEWDNTFFCATSSFNVAPGVPVFASKDLQSFRQIGMCIKGLRAAIRLITHHSFFQEMSLTGPANSRAWRIQTALRVVFGHHPYGQNLELA